MATEEKKMLTRYILNEKYERAFEDNRMIYVGGMTGLGKTASVKEWLSSRQRSYSYISAKDKDFFSTIVQKNFKKKETVVFDDLEVIQKEEEQLELYEYIKNSNSKYILIGRSKLPGWLKPFFAMRQLVLFDQNDLILSEEEIEEFYLEYNIVLTRKQLDQVYRDTHGIALCVLVVGRHLDHEAYSERVLQKAKQDVFDCLDYMFFQPLSEEEGRFILSMATTDSFNIRLVSLMTGEKDIDVITRRLNKFGDVFEEVSTDRYSFLFSEFREYLLQKQKAKFPEEDIRAICRRVGQYYEEKGDIHKAIPYYVKSNDSEKVSELLIENTKRHASDALFYDTEKYYNSLPREYILKSPELMCGMSMMQSISLRPEESEEWYDCLKSFAKNVDKKDERYEIAKEKLLYLDICLPHRGSGNLTDVIHKVAGVLSSSNKISLQDVSVTANLPSVMNGGKDFCHWSKKDRIMYKTMRKPVELILGKSGIGLADLGLAESLFEKSEDLNFTEPLEYLNRSLSKIMMEGSAQMQFAATGVMSRIFMASGSMDSAFRILKSIREKISQESSNSLMPNMKAYHTQLSLYAGDYDAVNTWMEDEAPNELKRFWIQKNYEYLIKVRIYILQEKYTEALALLNRLKMFYQNYGRPYGQMQFSLLIAIIHYRMNDGRWNDELNTALLQCEEYRFTRIVADEGMAMLELLIHLEYTGDTGFYRTVLYLTRQQAENYPLYLVAVPDSEIHLTILEKKVMKLIAQGVSNEKIAKILNIRARTVKFHTGNIYTKLKVKNRAQAIMAAIENNLI